jgi:hypothetical protein
MARMGCNCRGSEGKMGAVEVINSGRGIIWAAAGTEINSQAILPKMITPNGKMIMHAQMIKLIIFGTFGR